MKIALLTCLLLCPLLVFAQAKSPTKKPVATKSIVHAPLVKIEGVGKFKIGKTTLAVIPELETEMETRVKRIATTSELIKGEGGDILEMVPDTISQYDGPVYASQCLAAKVYLLPAYQVAEINLSNVKLTFLRGVLVDFHCDGSTELTEALELKYGKTTIKVEKKPVPCTFTYTGQKVTYNEETYTQSWNTSPLTVVAVTSKYYDSDCKQKVLSYFSVFDGAATKKIYNCEQASAARREAVANREKKKKLGDL